MRRMATYATNIGTLFAFVLVCAGVLVLRVKEPERPRPFKVPFRVGRRAARRRRVPVRDGSAFRAQAWERFVIWLVIGAVLYASYGYRHSATADRRPEGRSPVGLASGC